MIKEVVHFLRHGPELMRLQKHRSRAECFDALNARADEQGYAEIRRELVSELSGRILDLGCGTGSMFAHYGPDVEVDAIEPEQDFLALALAKAEKSQAKIRAATGDGMRLGFPDDTFDAVVLGLVLCSVASVERVVAEAFRVLRPSGQLRALEHVRSETAIGGRLMDLTNPLWLKLNKQGCHWNRNPIAHIEAAGFRIDEIESFQRFDTVVPAFPMRRIRAHKPGR